MLSRDSEFLGTLLLSRVCQLFSFEVLRILSYQRCIGATRKQGRKKVTEQKNVGSDSACGGNAICVPLFSFFSWRPSPDTFPPPIHPGLKRQCACVCFTRLPQLSKKNWRLFCANSCVRLKVLDLAGMRAGGREGGRAFPHLPNAKNTFLESEAPLPPPTLLFGSCPRYGLTFIRNATQSRNCTADPHT